MDILPIISAFITLVTPNPDMRNVKLEKRQIRLEKKKLRIAEKMYKNIEKEFNKDGLTEKENTELESLKKLIIDRKIALMSL
jgi:hypothetical protein